MARNTADSPGKYGRPPLSKAQIDAVLKCKKDGLSPKEAVAATGVKKTKVYELYRVETIHEEHAETSSDFHQDGAA